MFERDAPPGNDSQKSHLFIMAADGTNIRQLTPPVKPSGRDFSMNIFSRYEVINNDKKKSSVYESKKRIITIL